MRNDLDLHLILRLMEDALSQPMPHPVIRYAAQFVVTEYDRSAIPDWVVHLALRSDLLWPELVYETRKMIDEKE